ncbi:cysteine-rich receptor-like protein kinase 25 [Gastrolobium bilobum]|uniref:cysteine-rich receptor-like protein kinase 25 n=1 Tax=Gastrolobium bilobum TaxID=150636 RepID=UPI002AB115CD|nr:cysteine-rich receptor-like protein kinase 25 [Gastrolobium bilobum]
MVTSKQYWATFYTLLPLFGMLSLATQSFPTYVGSYCNNNTTYAPDSRLGNNLNVLLYTLTTNASQQQDGYYMTIMGFGTTDAVNGLFLCRGDLNTTMCQQCVATAAKEITRRCTNQTEAVIWYEECLLRYTNRYFKYYSIVPGLYLPDGNNVSAVDLQRFNQSLFSLFDELTTEAANSPSAKKFATGEVGVTSSQTVYGLAQCTTDLTSSQCETCLQSAIGTLPACCSGQQGASAMLSSCIVRYELYPFYSKTGLPSSSSSGKNKLGTKTIVIIVFAVFIPVKLLLLGWYCLRRRSKTKRRTILKENFGDELKTLESLQFSLATVEAATNKFSQENKIGKGGFGVVYKGVFLDGRQIAVKKLSRSSGQGSHEFKNEILLIAKLQHRNLVTLLGFCLEDQEKILIYEYVPNKSLDYFLFDTKKQRILHWFERYKIIGGIARGILYLHEHSRLKVIHRDLKPSNVLLDDNMNPKISDFGLAKIVTIDEEQGNTNRIVGTYGYMSPEYAMHGQFSEKSDVFSFGVIILEIVSAKRNARPIESHDFDDLLSTAWRQWRNQTPLEILDPNLKDSFSPSEVIKCIQVGLLCVQDNPDNRPTMAKIVSYFGSLLVELPIPGEPAFSMDNGAPASSSGQSTNYSAVSSINDMSKNPSENATDANFQSNLTSLLDSLSLKVSLQSFYNDSISSNLYGLFLCRGDVSSDTCQNCTRTASEEIKTRCEYNTSAIIWYEKCMLRYSKKNFFGKAQTYPEAFMWNVNNRTSPIQDDIEAQALIYQLIKEASNTDMLFKTGKSLGKNESQNRYGLVQCTRDINGSSCATCLSQLMKEAQQFCQHKVGWRIMGPSCNIRYERYIFYQHTLVPPDISTKQLVLPVIPITVVAILLGLGWVSCSLWKSRKRGGGTSDEIQVKNLKSSRRSHFKKQGMNATHEDNSGEVHYFSLRTIKVATNYFSDGAKLGEGGFGPVFKGKLINGKEIAVKRLLFKSRQGLEEFKNEMVLIAKLQHRNLVRLLGCCLDENEKLLVYEYMTNTSLDVFLFDPNKRIELEWPKRVKIINGIAKGLLYLHEDSRLKIIHRDLKASNVLLDEEMNPKISDFGTARIFGGNQIEATTERVVGTYGYMAPEYALEGLFSIKSDVYSFGVLILEIMSGRKNTGFYQSERGHCSGQSLISDAWRLWSEGKGLQFMDPFLVNSCPIGEALRWIHIGLLCVQERPMDRPTISSVVLMLGSAINIPRPSAPPFSIGRYFASEQSSTTGREIDFLPSSSNDSIKEV